MNNAITLLNLSYALGHQLITNELISICVASAILSVTVYALIKHYKNDLR